MTRDSPEARRMAQTIDWLGVAWRNTVSLTPELRIVALKTAFEVLLDVGDGEQQQRQMLSSLLDTRDVERMTRTWTTLGGREKQADLSDLEWWFLHFTFRRNKIAHGEEVGESDFDFEDGRHRFWLADARLQAAIKELIARAGFPDLRFDYASRQCRGAYREAGADPNTLESLDGGQEGQNP